jgi:putative MATE family efflux protein
MKLHYLFRGTAFMAKGSKRKDLTKGNIKKQILFMTLPMILGMLGMVVFNFVDALYVGRLGQDELAAIAFTFPVVMFVMSISQGLGMGTGSVVSKYIGEKNEKWIKKTSTYSLALAVTIVATVAGVGLLTIKPLFTLLGATETELPLINGYMRVWYLGVPFVVIPMVGNHIIRALGDTKIPSLAMTIAAGLNIILDPIFIFGWGFEGFGIVGAALATVIARMTTFVFALYILIKREKVITFHDLHIKEFFVSAKDVLFIALPSAVARAIIPLGTGVITAMIAAFGTASVAGFGAGVKIENLALCVANALSTVMIAVIGQNFGAKQFDRIKLGYKTACAYSLIYSAIMIPVFFFSAPALSMLFKVGDEVRLVMVQYVRIAVFGVGFIGIITVSASALNAIRKPIKSALMYFVFMFGLYIPIASLLSKRFETTGIFYAVIIAYVVAGFVSYLVTSKEIKKLLI